MVDVSVRFQIAGDAEVVLNLPTTQAVRLIEAIMHNVAEAMATQARGGQQVQPSLQGSVGWGDTQLRGEPPPTGQARRPLG
ncbi:hypothetical protein [Frankia sp. Cppng1_Ct_nod]|uniref:hypothetical protein n=1 Tax=Frankia sp. Cppng1_Ct_nod TaxID=2897162 RepID=UPI00104193D5|nr:hypothetical protein [Frankia sp. Cppng1_Ct_nod]